MHEKIDTSNIVAVKTGMNDEIEWSLVDTLRRVLRGYRFLVAFTAAGLVIGILISLFWPKWYTAEAVFLPPPRTAELMPSAAGASASALLMGQQDPSDMYLGMLGSRTVEDDVIDHLGLMTIYHAKEKQDARNVLKGQSKFTVDKNSFILVKISTKNPKLSASIANAYLDALYRLNGSMVASAAAYRKAFYEDQMERQKEALDAAEVALKQVEEKTGIVLPQGEAEAGLRAIVDLQTAIGTAEARLSAVRVGATENNPQVVQARAELAALRAQLAKQQAASANHGPRSGLASSAALPGLTMEYVRKMREVKLNETLYDSLTQQYEKARIASLDPGPQFQIVDRAIVPEHKAGPPRVLIILGSVILGFLIGLIWVLFKEPLHRLVVVCLNDPIPFTER
jgi:uncharacterized protein involved in exopolysaccharide biosynthesis